MTRSAEILLASLIDYAGTFPPATLGLAQAAAEYARQRSAISRAMLGRFVLAAADLDAFEALPSTVVASGTPWPLAIVGKRETMPDAARLRRFDQAMKGRAAIVAVEFAPMPPPEIEATAQALPSGIEAIFEVSAVGDFGSSLTAIAASGACAKIRTGGVTADAFPDAMALVGFMQACHDARVPFKATAGLHHAVCGSYPLTYQPNSARATMYGFLNVSVAAALIYSGSTPAVAVDALQDSATGAFTFSDASLVWRGQRLALELLADTRRKFFKSFGSCAFQEPVEELMRLGIIESRS